MHDEFESVILAIPVESYENDTLHDFVFFYFNKNLSNLKLYASAEVNVDLKDFVGSAYESSVRAMVKAAREDAAVWDDFAPLFQNNGQALENLSHELTKMRNMYQERLLASCDYYLDKLSSEYGRN